MAAGLLVAALAALALGGAWYTAPLWHAGTASAAQSTVAGALATRDLVALGRLDVARAAALQSRLLGDPDPDALLTPDDSFMTSLARAGIDPRRQLADAVVAAYADVDADEASGPLWVAAVLTGDFDPDAVRRWLTDRYQVDRYDPATSTAYFSWTDAHACRPSSPHALRISDHRLVLAPPDRIDALWNRLQTGAAAEVPIDQWRHLADGQLLTLGVFAPSALQQARGGMLGMLLAGAGKAVAPASALYFGATPTLLPPGVTLDASIASDDADFVRKAHTAADAWLDDARKRAARDFPPLLSLYDRVAFSAADGAVHGSLRLDTHFDEELRTLLSGVLAPAVQVSPGGPASGMAVTERLADHPPQFADASPDQLKPYASFGDGFFTPQWQQGPFALTVSSLAVGDDGTLQVGLRGEGRGLPNLGARSELARLKITDVVDRQGRSLLPADACGPHQPRDWVDFGSLSQGMQFEDGKTIRYPTVSLQKTLTLAPGVRPADVAAIRGRIEFMLPSRVQVTRVAAPLAGKAVEGSHVRVRFQPASANSLRYQVSGETRRLVALRGLNGDGEVLATSGSSWGDNWFGGGLQASVDLHGTAAAAEVVLAEQLSPVRYEFELPGAYPPVTTGQTPPPLAPEAPATPEAVTAGLSVAPPAVTFDHQKPLTTTAAGPGLVAVKRVQVTAFSGLLAQLELYVSNQLPLADQLNAATLTLDKAVLPDGTTRDLDLTAPVTLSHDGGYWVNGEYRTDPDRPWLVGRAALQALHYKDPEPSVLEGHLMLRANARTETADLSTAPGDRWQHDGMDLTVSGWEENSLEVRIDAGADRIASIAAVDDAGNVVGRADGIDTNRGGVRVELHLYAHPSALRVTYALKTDAHELPFRLAFTP